MRYIWEDYSKEKRFYIRNSFSPYTEVSYPFANSADEAYVNIILRFQNIFCNQEETPDVSGKSDGIYNAVLHMLAQKDYINSITGDDIKKDIVSYEIMEGRYGEKVRNLYSEMTSADRHLIKYYLEKYRKSGEREELFDEVFYELFGTSSTAEIFYQKTNDIYYCYCSAEENEYNSGRFELIRLLFAVCTRKITPVWGHCFGIIGEENPYEPDYPIAGNIKMI